MSSQRDQDGANVKFNDEIPVTQLYQSQKYKNSSMVPPQQVEPKQ